MSLIEISKKEFKDIIRQEAILVIFFYTHWSGSSQLILSALEQFSNELSNKVKIYKIDSEKHIELCLEYQINTTPTLIVFKNRKVRRIFEGLISKSLLKMELEKLV